MKRVFATLAIVGLLLLAGGCSNEPASTPVTAPALAAAEQHQAYCDGFNRLTPGTLESTEAFEVLADPDSTPAQKSEALKKQMDANVRTTPYNCESPTDRRLFDAFISEQTNSHPPTS
ncbi:hypothetical protein [Rhodococcus sp. KB6]|uniref:hypothetical protein n=1 Tax=Rhodococcus sp. KB6 TaxID=1752066 RepID=UPI000A67435E|nr:hypothetical protein [Rhodococcus sp. KB6]